MSNLRSRNRQHPKVEHSDHANGDKHPKDINGAASAQRSKDISKNKNDLASIRYDLEDALLRLCDVWFDEIKPFLISNKVKLHTSEQLRSRPGRPEQPDCQHLYPGAALDHQQPPAASSAKCCSPPPAASSRPSRRRPPPPPAAARPVPTPKMLSQALSGHQSVTQTLLPRHSIPRPILARNKQQDFLESATKTDLKIKQEEVRETKAPSVVLEASETNLESRLKLPLQNHINLRGGPRRSRPNKARSIYVSRTKEIEKEKADLKVLFTSPRTKQYPSEENMICNRKGFRPWKF